MYSDIIRGSSSGYVRNEKNNVDTQRIYTVIKIKSADTEYNKHLPHPFYYLLVMTLSLPIYTICHIRKIGLPMTGLICAHRYQIPR